MNITNDNPHYPCRGFGDLTNFQDEKQACHDDKSTAKACQHPSVTLLKCLRAAAVYKSSNSSNKCGAINDEYCRSVLGIENPSKTISEIANQGHVINHARGCYELISSPRLIV